MSPTPQAQAQNNDSPVHERVQAIKAGIHHRRHAHAARFELALQRHAEVAAETKEFKLAELTPAEGGTSLPAELLLKAKGAVNPDAIQMMASANAQEKPVQRFEVEHTNKASGPTSSPSTPGDTVPALA